MTHATLKMNGKEFVLVPKAEYRRLKQNGAPPHALTASRGRPLPPSAARAISQKPNVAWRSAISSLILSLAALPNATAAMVKTQFRPSIGGEPENFARFLTVSLNANLDCKIVLSHQICL